MLPTDLSPLWLFVFVFLISAIYTTVERSLHKGEKITFKAEWLVPLLVIPFTIAACYIVMIFFTVPWFVLTAWPILLIMLAIGLGRLIPKLVFYLCSLTTQQ
ncbi:hypothetical protein [Shouchella lonarensis]|uniref:Uncharacterized protein n=1 Tax=Shouchella lonarensis TaxID=1464122 RepID=A0A1G6LYU3_9BACI|nr:hypothetical protein [Shouchella lonarensis]SDC48214.1 hypothetical protein SAMN05421737_10939 [Shouchella lonarensis]